MYRSMNMKFAVSSLSTYRFIYLLNNPILFKIRIPVKIAVYWNVMPCSQVDTYQSFGGNVLLSSLILNPSFVCTP